MKNESEQNKLVIFKLLMQSVATFEENIFSRKKDSRGSRYWKC